MRYADRLNKSNRTEECLFTGGEGHVPILVGKLDSGPPIIIELQPDLPTHVYSATSENGQEYRVRIYSTKSELTLDMVCYLFKIELSCGV